MPLYLQKKITTIGQIALWKLSESLEELRSIHPLSPIEQVEFDTLPSNKRKIEWITIRILLNMVLEKKVDLAHSLSGKPILENSSFHLSVSHSMDFVAVFFSKTQEIGIDVEKIRSNMAHLKNKFLHSKEMKVAHDADHIQLHFFWGAKEAMFKQFSQYNPLATENLYLTNINLDQQTAVGNICTQIFSQQVHAEFKKVEDNLLVWTY